MKLAKKTDLLIVAALLLCGAAVWFVYRSTLARRPAAAEIYYGSALAETVALDTGGERTFSLPQNERVVLHLSADGRIRFESSDCPDQVCVRAGWLGRAGESAACLPNQIILKIVPADGRDDGEADLIVG